MQDIPLESHPEEIRDGPLDGRGSPCADTAELEWDHVFGHVAAVGHLPDNPQRPAWGSGFMQLVAHPRLYAHFQLAFNPERCERVVLHMGAKGLAHYRASRHRP